MAGRLARHLGDAARRGAGPADHQFPGPGSNRRVGAGRRSPGVLHLHRARRYLDGASRRRRMAAADGTARPWVLRGMVAGRTEPGLHQLARRRLSLGDAGRLRPASTRCGLGRAPGHYGQWGRVESGWPVVIHPERCGRGNVVLVRPNRWQPASATLHVRPERACAHTRWLERRAWPTGPRRLRTAKRRVGDGDPDTLMPAVDGVR